MSQSTQSALKALEEAKCLEQEGQAFYQKAAGRTESAKGREVFRSLIKDEVMHERLIDREIESLKQSGKWTKVPEAEGASCDLGREIFPQGREGLKKTVKVETSDMDALLVAMEFEAKSFDLYRRGAEEAKDPEAKEVYLFLASQEQNHFDLLMSNWEAMTQLGGWSD
jgi:rubrerythrin